MSNRTVNVLIILSVALAVFALIVGGVGTIVDVRAAVMTSQAVPTMTLVPTQTARVVIKVITATPAPPTAAPAPTMTNLPPLTVPCGEKPEYRTPIRLRFATTVREWPASFGKNLGQAEAGIVRLLVQYAIAKEDGEMWFQLYQVPTSDHPEGVEYGWVKALYAECLRPTITPEGP